MQKLLQAITNTDCGFQHEAPQNKLSCYRRPVYQLRVEKIKDPDCCTRAELIREVDIYLVISF